MTELNISATSEQPQQCRNDKCLWVGPHYHEEGQLYIGNAFSWSWSVSRNAKFIQPLWKRMRHEVKDGGISFKRGPYDPQHGPIKKPMKKRKRQAPIIPYSQKKVF